MAEKKEVSKEDLDRLKARLLELSSRVSSQEQAESEVLFYDEADLYHPPDVITFGGPVSIGDVVLRFSEELAETAAHWDDMCKKLFEEMGEKSLRVVERHLDKVSDIENELLIYDTDTMWRPGTKLSWADEAASLLGLDDLYTWEGERVTGVDFGSMYEPEREHDDVSIEVEHAGYRLSDSYRADYPGTEWVWSPTTAAD